MSIQTSKGAQKTLRTRRDALETIRIRDLGTIMGTVEGRRFVFDLIDRRCLVFSQSYTGNSETYLREGQRKVGIDLMVEIQREYPSQYVMMLQEQFTLQKQDRLTEEAAKAVAEADHE